MYHKRLFIPGPVEVRPEMLLTLATPQIGHRSSEWKAIYKEVTEKLRKLLRTKNDVLLFTSSSTGAWEPAVRQGVQKKVLCTTCGAFSERWHTTAVMNGVPNEALAYEWGKGVKTKDIDAKLATGEFDAITYVLNETATGVRNPVEEVAELLKTKYPDVFLMVDAVSAMAGEDIPVDDLGIDFILAGLQKCFGLPAGLTVVAVSPRFYERAAKAKTPGYYFNVLEMKKNHDKGQTLTTPAIPQALALNRQLDDMFEFGIEKRYKRHEDMAKAVQAWAKEHFAMFPEAGYWSKTVSCIDNTRGISVADLNKALAEHHCMISNGYGKLKEKCFRIAHMADTEMWEILGLLALIDRILGFKKWA